MSQVKLEYGDPVELTLTLKAPIFGNKEISDHPRIYHQTRGGKSLVLADSSWVPRYILKMQIVCNTEEEVDDFEYFLQYTLGNTVTLTDHLDRVWAVILTNPNAVITQIYRQCGATFNIECQGSLITNNPQLPVPT